MRGDTFDSGDDINHHVESPQVIGIISEYGPIKSTLHVYREDMILDPMYPAMERTSFNRGSSFFRQRFGALFQSDKKVCYAKRITSIELLGIYSINIDTTISVNYEFGHTCR